MNVRGRAWRASNSGSWRPKTSGAVPEVVRSTGPRQPGAVRLYLATGYEAQFDPTLDPETIGHTCPASISSRTY